ncbi:ABC transporter ATP-binding/permease protein [Fructobacillus fructosus]|uniref:ABC transporter ATP-binding protein n=1 Tax=Fructobacillus fructosus TaxID=1631 RepID=UPI00021940BC|nr:ABC transporter ATP-binding protein [Fructobacillus fructosus]KRN52016.1 ABC transporter ATP-binding permease protein [Fructobacillus fructosus KCTC 3544]GAP01636.1 ABC transporter ATP-binding/permease protein [Fructobacillus fructosus]
MELLITYARPYWKKITVAILAVTMMALATLTQPQFLEKMMAAIIADKSDLILKNGFYLLLLALVGIVAGVTGTYFASQVSQSVAADIRQAEYEKIQQFSLEQVQSYSSANLVVRLTNDINQVQQLVMQSLQMVLRVPILFVGAIILSIWTLPSLWWVVLLMIVLIVLSSKRIFAMMGRYFGKIQQLIDQNNTLAQENLSGVRVVKSFNQQGQEEASFAQNTQELTDVNRRIGYLFNLMFPIFMLISYAAIAAAMLFISTSIKETPDQLAKITPFITYLNQILMALLMLGMISTFASRGFVSLKRIAGIMAEKTEHQKKGNQLAMAKEHFLTKELTVRDVSFTYPKAENAVLHDLSFTLPAGQTLGVVGSTGSGKSTLALLLARLYQADAGQITVDGHAIEEIASSDWHQSVAIVMQKPVLFSGTIASNLKMGKEDASPEEMAEAVDAAQAADFVDAYPDGLEHEIAERSANLSGGQKQRLSLARALVKKPRLLILDDATSALDARSERRVQDVLANDFQKTTKVIIAEKIASIIHADQIIVLDAGQIVGVGSHNELLSNSPVYREIYQSQKGKGQEND